MTHRHINILTAIALVILACVIPACSKDSFSDISEPEQNARPTMGITVALGGTPHSTRAGEEDEDSDNGGYEVGEGIENYLDIKNNNFRIYFFDEEDKYIATFNTILRPTAVSGPEYVNGVSTYYYYEFRGEVPVDLPLTFKLVTLFNWPKYPEEAVGADNDTTDPDNTGALKEFKLIKGHTTIQDICRHGDAQFNAITVTDENSTWLSKDETGRLIPFYGVREYDLENYTTEFEVDNEGNKKIKGNIYINLNQPIRTATNNDVNPTPLPLIRAMAKVELILTNPIIADFDQVVITRINPRGCCAPKDATSHDDYDHGYDWGNDFIRDVHIPVWSGTESSESVSTNAPTGIAIESLPMTRVTTASEEGAPTNVSPRKWIAYVPEYKNLGEPEETSLCRIEVRLNGVSSFVYFSRNGKNTTDPNSSDRYNIERNNIYRFTITDMTVNPECKVDIQPFAEQKLEFTFGFLRDERGDLKVIPDENKIYPDFFNNFLVNHPLPTDKYTGKDLEVTEGDYYAIVVGEYSTMDDAEVWLKDSEGCRVLTNFSTLSDEDAQDCRSREVIYFFGVKQTEYNKDIHGDRRIYHFSNHNSIVINSEDKMCFKMLNEDGTVLKRYLVESWDEETHTGWILANEILSDDGKEVTATFRNITSDGVLGNESKTVVIPNIKG